MAHSDTLKADTTSARDTGTQGTGPRDTKAPPVDENVPDGLTTSATAATPVSLARRAPTKFTHTVRAESHIHLSSLEIKRLYTEGECVRAKRILIYHTEKLIVGTGTSRSGHGGGGGGGGGGGLTQTREISFNGFPYPAKFQPFAEGRGEVLIDGVDLTNNRNGVIEYLEATNRGREVNTVFAAMDNVRQKMRERPLEKERTFGFDFNCFSYTRKSVMDVDVPVQPTYIILGIFRPGQIPTSASPLSLGQSAFSENFVGLPSDFGCDPEKGTHERVALDKSGVADLQLLYHMYSGWRVSGETAHIWADWIHSVLNNGSNDVTKGQYALELVLGWSTTRIALVILLPVLLSLAVGLCLNSSSWTDLATIQTAWGTASYIVTRGGRESGPPSASDPTMCQLTDSIILVLAALLAILSGIETDSE
ncbi:hypothetical protein F5Y17DRAFT_460407 [Xylariaceae sp. FL0594]|nr:hypothetical protein F5Y17DRAFT_460407 [Xylariaceae sp. FL0594]